MAKSSGKHYRVVSHAHSNSGTSGVFVQALGTNGKLVNVNRAIYDEAREQAAKASRKVTKRYSKQPA